MRVLLCLGLSWLVAATSLAVTPIELDHTPGGTGSWVGLVGVPGGIPAPRPTATIIPCGGNPCTTTVATVQAALDNAPANTQVVLAAGTYNFPANNGVCIRIDRSDVTLSGSVDANGNPTTIINASGHGVTVGDYNSWYNRYTNPGSVPHRTITAGLNQGSYTVTVSDASGFVAGQLVQIDQLNDSNTTAESPANCGGNACRDVCYNPTPGPSFNDGFQCGYCGNDNASPTPGCTPCPPSPCYFNQAYCSVDYPGDSGGGRDRFQQQTNRVFSVSGNQITLYEPIYMPNWSSSGGGGGEPGLAPQIWYWNSDATKVRTGVGVENIYFITSNSAAAIFDYTYGCWAKNLKSTINNTAGPPGAIMFRVSIRGTWSHCKLYEGPPPNPYAVYDRYGLLGYIAAGLLWENNINEGHNSFVMLISVTGSAIAYNYDSALDYNGTNNYLRAGLFNHGGMNSMNLFEGNHAITIQQDTTWQGTNYWTGLRNRLVGKSSTGNSQSNNQAVAVMEKMIESTYVGNVLGTTGWNQTYQDTYGPTHGGADHCNGSNGRVWLVGTRGAGEGRQCWRNQAGYDPAVLSTLNRAMNWDSANQGIIDAGSYTIDDVPNSLYLTSKPAFFGSLAWPPFSPTDPANSAGPPSTRIPAGFREANGGADPPSDIVPLDRRIDWGNGNVGPIYQGTPGIPDTSAWPICHSLSPSGGSDDSNLIRIAINSCGEGEVVQLEAGTFNVGIGIAPLAASRKVLRGRGESTVLAFNSPNSLESAFFVRGTNAPHHGSVVLSANAVKGTSVVTVSSVPSWVTVGRLYYISQRDDSAFVSHVGTDNSNEPDAWKTITTSGSGCTSYTTPGVTPCPSESRSMGQLNKVLSKTSTTITFETPLYWNYSTALVAAVSEAPYTPTAAIPVNIGFENFTIAGNFTDAAHSFFRFENTDSCWLKNVKMLSQPGRSAVRAEYSYRLGMEHCWLTDARYYGAGGGYGISLSRLSTAALIQNNVFSNFRAGVDLSYTAAGNVIGYNYIGVGQAVSNMSPSIALHSVHNWMNLIEGNYCAEYFGSDITLGSSSHTTVYRNVIPNAGPSSTASSRTSAVYFDQYNRYPNIVGNILGLAGFHNGYDRAISGAQYGCADSHKTIYSFGCGQSPEDSVTTISPLRYLNFDYSTNGIVTGGVPLNSMRDSYYLSSKPSWFGSLTWPPYVPDNAAGATAEKIPAGYRWLNGYDPSYLPAPTNLRFVIPSAAVDE